MEIVRQWDEYVADLPREIGIDRAKAEAGHINEWLRRYDTGSMVAKFCLGTIAYLANPNWRNERKYGQGTIETLAEKHHINANVLREARRCVEFFGLDLELYYSWLTEDDDRLKTWTDVRRLIRAWDDPEVLGPEALSERLALRIESAGEDLQRLRERAHEGDIDEEMYEGTRSEFLNDVRSFDEDKEEALEEPSVETPRDEEYMNFIREQPCIATGSEPPNEPHHVEQGGEGMKGSDWSCVPLASHVHDYVEDRGHRAAEEKWNFRFGQAIARLMHKYIKSYELQFPPDIAHLHRKDQTAGYDAAQREDATGSRQGAPTLGPQSNGRDRS